MDKLPLDLSALIRYGPRATCEELINPAVFELTAAFNDPCAASGAESTPAGEDVPLRCTTRMDLVVICSGSVPLSNEAGDTNDIMKAEADLIGDGSPPHPSASHTVNSPSLSRSDDDES